jgi:membrane protein
VVDEQGIGADQGTEFAENLPEATQHPTALKPGRSSRVSTLRDKGSATVAQVKQGSVGAYWSRLTAVDFMNSSMVFAALALLCLFPFLTILAAATGRNIRHTIIIRLGLNPKAASDIDDLISSGQHAVTSLTVLGGAFLVFGMIGLAATLQGWYRRVYDQPPHGGLKAIASEAVWVTLFVAYITIQVQIGQHVGPLGDHVLVFASNFICAVIFWTVSAYVLLLGQVSWRALIPTGIATGVCVTGLAVFSFLLFSSSLISGFNNYGPIGAMSTLLSFFIGLGVCVHLGAVFGRLWNERHGIQPEHSTSLEPTTAISVSGQNESTRGDS